MRQQSKANKCWEKYLKVRVIFFSRIRTNLRKYELAWVVNRRHEWWIVSKTWKREISLNVWTLDGFLLYSVLLSPRNFDLFWNSSILVHTHEWVTADRRNNILIRDKNLYVFREGLAINCMGNRCTLVVGCSQSFFSDVQRFILALLTLKQWVS